MTTHESYPAAEWEEMIFEAIMVELDSATKHYGSISTPHEAYAIIKEELDEFWDEVKKKKPSLMEMRKELIQVAAMAIRAINDIA